MHGYGLKKPEIEAPVFVRTALRKPDEGESKKTISAKEDVLDLEDEITCIFIASNGHLDKREMPEQTAEKSRVDQVTDPPVDVDNLSKGNLVDSIGKSLEVCERQMAQSKNKF